MSGQSRRKVQVGIGDDADFLHRVNPSEHLVSNNRGRGVEGNIDRGGAGAHKIVEGCKWGRCHQGRSL